MMDKLPKSFVVMHDRLGPIHVTRRRSSSRISGRWKDGRAYFNVPDFLDGSRILSEIEQLASKMIAGKKDVKFYYGQCLEFDGLRAREFLHTRTESKAGFADMHTARCYGLY